MLQKAFTRMEPDLLINIRSSLEITKVAIERQDKTLESNTDAIAELQKVIANNDLRLRNIEAHNLTELVFMVRSMKESFDSSSRKLNFRTNTLIYGTILALITSLINLTSSGLFNSLFTHSNNSSPATTKGK